MHLLASFLYDACYLSLILGAIIFLRNAIRRSDVPFEARFPWWVRLAFYLVILVIPPVLIRHQGMGLDSSVWINSLLAVVALAIPLVGLLRGLWLVAFRRSRERIKLGKGLLFVSLIPVTLFFAVSLDQATRGIN